MEDLQRQLERAQRKADMYLRHLNDWRKMYADHANDYRQVLDAFGAETDRLREQNAQLRAALADYGRHKGACDMMSVGGPCSCGLAQALEA